MSTEALRDDAERMPEALRDDVMLGAIGQLRPLAGYLVAIAERLQKQRRGREVNSGTA